MANLHGFRDDLLLEQEHRKGVAPKESISASASTSSKGQNLGHVFLVLFQASRSAVKKALVNLEAESTCCQNLWSNLFNKDESRALLQLFTFFVFLYFFDPRRAVEIVARLCDTRTDRGSTTTQGRHERDGQDAGNLSPLA